MTPAARCGDTGTVSGVTWAPCCFWPGFFFCNFVSRIILGPLLPAIETDMHLGHGTVGSFFLFISIGYFISLAGSGFVSARLSHRHTITLSATAVGLVLVGLSVSQNLATIRLALVCLGLAAGLYLPSAIATITAMVNIRHWGKALAIHELAPNSGFMAAPLLAETLMIWIPWRGVLVVLGVTTAVLGLAQARWGARGPIRRSAAGSDDPAATGGRPALLAHDSAVRTRHRQHPGDLHDAAPLPGCRTGP